MPDLSKLNEAQRKAVTWGEGPLLLLAGPGSGKTFTITNRILYLLEQGVSPESILVITFTREAAVSMQRRFQNMSETVQPVNFGTFHSVFYHILQESGRFRHLKILTDSQKRNLLIPILKKYKEKSGEAYDKEELREEAGKILSAFGFYKNTLNIGLAEKKVPDFWAVYFGQILADYDRTVRDNGCMDFDDMLFECRKLFGEKKEILAYWRKRFTHILIDEFQDINPVQYEVIKFLAEKPYNLFAVGDDDQSIYGFRGSQPDILRQFAEEFKAEKMLLDINYRSGEKIVNASLAVISENKNRFSKALTACPRDAERMVEAGRTENELCIREFQNREEQYAYLLNELEKWRKNHSEDGKSCALLFRTNSHMQGMAARLKSVGLPFCMNERVKSIYEHFIVKDIMAYLLLASGGWDRTKMLQVMNRPSRYISREAVGERNSIEEIAAYYKTAACSDANRKKILKNLETFRTQLANIQKMPPGLAVNYILKAVNYEEYLKSIGAGNTEKMAEWQELTEWLKADGARYRTVKDWVEAQRQYTAALEQQHQGKTEKSDEVIRLMTVHGAKGLEFHKVFIPDCNENVFPHGNMPDRETVEEERRIFYVAMTRAKKSLELLYLTGDRTRPRLPSRFLNPLIYSSSSINSSNSQLSRYSSKASATFSYTSSSSI